MRQVLNKLFRSAVYTAFRRWVKNHREEHLPGSMLDLTQVAYTEGTAVMLNG